MFEALIKLCRASDVPEGGALKVESGGLVLAVFNLGGRYFVIDDHCTHGPGSLSEGCVDGEEIECDFHNGRYHIPTGAVTAPPCMVPVRLVQRARRRRRGVHRARAEAARRRGGRRNRAGVAAPLLQCWLRRCSSPPAAVNFDASAGSFRG